MRLTLLILTVLCAGGAFAGNGDYDVARISPALKENAHVVKRKEEIRFEVYGGESLYRKKYALTILDEEGDKFATFLELYDKFIDIRSIEGTLYDARGIEIKRLKNKDVLDLSAVGDNNLMDDNRMKVHQFGHRIYPYTVEYEVETRIKNTYSFPSWTPQTSEHISVQQSRFTISVPEGYKVRYKALNFGGKPVEAMEKTRKTLTWELQELPAIEDESLSPSWQDIVPLVLLAPSTFEFAGYKGDVSTWENLGKFTLELNKGRDELPPATKQKVASLTAGLTDPRQKVKALYEYLQKTTRYISIQLGLGGLQPLEAKFVAEKSYGDCKALTNYMYSLLKEAAYVRTIRWWAQAPSAFKIYPDFPADKFDHIILCVPLAKDTMWLECTSQTAQPGYLGDFTSNRYVLLVDETGGKLVTTPSYRMNDNVRDRRVKAVVNETGDMKASILTSYLAVQQDEVHSLMHSSKQKVKEYLQKNLDFSTYELDNFNYEEFSTYVPGIKESLDLSVSKYATVSGKRLFIQPNLISRSYWKPSTDKRRYDICVRYEYRDTDTAEIELPAGYKPESVPQDVTLQTKFGTYKSSVRVNGNKLLYTRTIERSSGRYPPSDYESFAAFYTAIYKADRSKVVLVKE